MPTITAHSRPGDDRTENEDWYAATDDLQVVLDGATIRTDTGCIHGLPWYVRQLGAAIVAGAQDAETTLADVLAAAIRHVAALHANTCDLSHSGTPSAAAGIVRITGEQVQWLVLGDITVILDIAAGPRAITDDRVSQTGIELRRECDRYPIGSPEKMTAILAMKQVELASRNVDGGYWIAATDPTAVDHANTGSVPRDQVGRLALCSDGAMRILTMTAISGPAGVLGVLRGSGPAVLVDQVRTAERHDPLGKRVPRNKATDDATAVYVDMDVQQPRRGLSEAERQAVIRGIAESTEGLFGASPTVTGRQL